MRELEAAVRWNRLACVKLLAGAAPYVNVNEYGDDDMNALHIACKLGYDEIVRVLIAVPGIDINTLIPPKLQTPLHVAAWNGHAEVVRILVSLKGIKLHLCDYESADALARAGDDEVIAIIEEAIAKQGVMDAKGRELCRAAYYCNLNELARLIDKYRDDEDALNWVFPEAGDECWARGHHQESDDEDDDAREERENFNDDSNELTPVLIAAKRGHKEAVRLLLATPRVNPHIADKDGKNILMFAAENDDHEMLRVVLSTVPEIDVNKTATNYGNEKVTAMDLGGRSYRRNRDDIVATLRAAGAKTVAELKAEAEV